MVRYIRIYNYAMSLPIEGGMLHSGMFAHTLLVNISLDCFPGTNALAYFAEASGTNIFLIILFKLGVNPIKLFLCCFNHNFL